MAKRTVKSSVGKNLGITIGAAYEGFIKEKKAKGLSEATFRNYNLSIDRFLSLNEIDENSIITICNKQFVVNWINGMIENGTRTTTINHYLRDIRAFLYWCMADEQGYLPSFKIECVKVQETLPKAFADDDLRVIMRKPKGKGDADFTEWRTWCIAVLAYDMGARAGSIADIRIEDINFTNNTIYLRHTKNKKLGTFHISTDCAKALKEFMKIYRWDCDGEEYLFCNSNGEALSYNGMRIAFQRYCTRRGVEQYNLHGLRHSFAQAFVKNTNGDMVRLQKALGHSTIDMSRKYVDISAVDMGDYDKISPLASAIEATKGAPKRKITARKAS